MGKTFKDNPNKYRKHSDKPKKNRHNNGQRSQSEAPDEYQRYMDKYQSDVNRF